ncbi:MAG: hypothetical protein ACI9XP_002108 [Lentimonas sp.]|jgi:hypothetical protein
MKICIGIALSVKKPDRLAPNHFFLGWKMGLTEAIFYGHSSLENMRRHPTSRPKPFWQKKRES